jgi:hypothetical protein
MTQGSKSPLAAAIAAALVPCWATAQTLVITQSGDGNALQVRQPGAIGATATINQDAMGASVSIDQFGAAHVARVDQAGDREGSATILQDAIEPAQATIEQTETVSSAATVRQTHSRLLDAAIVQTRSSLAISDVLQTMSNGSRVGVVQVDSANVDARVQQSGSTASVDILQQASNSSFVSVDQTSSQGQVRVEQIDGSQSSATVWQSNTAGSTAATLRLSGNAGTFGMVFQRDVTGDAVLLEQTGNRNTQALVQQEGRSPGGPKGTIVMQTGNESTMVRVFQQGGLQSAVVTQWGNVGVNGSIHQAFAWMPEATLEQSGNVAVDSSTQITQLGSTHDDAWIVQRGNRAPTLRAGIVQSAAESGGAAWSTGSFVPNYFDPSSHLWPSTGNYMNRAFVRQTYSNGDRAEAGIAMLNVERGESDLIQNYNDGDVLALHRMAATRNATGSITQEYNAPGTRVSGEIAQIGGAANAASLVQQTNLGQSVWMRAEQSGVQSATASGLQTGSTSVFGLITQQEGSTGSTGTIAQRDVNGGSAYVLQGTNDMSQGVIVPGQATALIALLNPDPGPVRGGAMASGAEIAQSEGTALAGRIVQTGAGLSATITQTGAWKEASLIQNGTGHVGTIVQGGVLMGSQASVVDLRQLGATPQMATITQNSVGSRIAVVQQ